MKYPMGVKYWIQFSEYLAPRVFVCVLHDVKTGLYVFKDRKTGARFTRNYHQLCANGFMPFLIPGAKEEEAKHAVV